MNIAQNDTTRELTADELESASGGTFTIDMGWCALALKLDRGFLTVAGGVGSNTGSVSLKLP
jgi:hypothetical protein